MTLRRVTSPEPPPGLFSPTLQGEPRCGKALYISPEMQTSPLPSLDFRRCDVWALGVMLFILLTGAPPMEASTTKDERFILIAQRGTLAELLATWRFPLSAPVVNLLQSMLREEPYQRPTAVQILGHEWLADVHIPQAQPGFSAVNAGGAMPPPQAPGGQVLGLIPPTPPS